MLSKPDMKETVFPEIQLILFYRFFEFHEELSLKVVLNSASFQFLRKQILSVKIQMQGKEFVPGSIPFLCTPIIVFPESQTNKEKTF